MTGQYKMTRHHIIPISRGGQGHKNLAQVPYGKHNLYHQLFENRTPSEIVQYLNREFWNDQYTGIEKLAIEDDRTCKERLAL